MAKLQPNTLQGCKRGLEVIAPLVVDTLEEPVVVQEQLRELELEPVEALVEMQLCIVVGELALGVEEQ